MLFEGREWIAWDTPVNFLETTTPAAPYISGIVKLYAKAKSGVSALYAQDDAGTEHEITGRTGGSGTANRVAYWVDSGTLGAIAALTQNRILFADANGLPDDDSLLYWDNTNKEVIIGHTAAPNSALAGFGLHIAKTAAEASASIYNIGTTAGIVSGLRLVKTRGTIALPDATQSGDGCFIDFGGYKSTGYANTGASIRMVANSNWNNSNTEAYITFHTTPNLSVTLAERFRIGPAGQWGIGGANYGTAGQYNRSGGSAAAPTWATIAASEIGSGANVTAGSSKITLGGTPTAAALLAFSIDVAEGNITHNNLGGLTTGDPHTQYALLAGRSGGQTLIGGTGSGDDLKIQSTSHSTKGDLIFGSSGNTTKSDVTNKWLVSETVTNSAAAEVTFWISTTLSGAGDFPQGARFTPSFTPSSTINAAYGFIGIGYAGPGSGVTIGELNGGYSAVGYLATAGAVTNGISHRIAAPEVFGSLKPTAQIGLQVDNQGATGITNAIGIQIAAQSGASNNWDMSFGTVDTTSAGTYYGRAPVLYNGLTKYIHLHNA